MILDAIKRGLNSDVDGLGFFQLFVIWFLLNKRRLELGPFGIDVINVVPGGIRTNIANSAVATFNKMPELKLYKPYEEAIRERAFLSQRMKPTPAEIFAKDTVAAVLKKNPPAWFSSGRYSTLMAIMYHMPLWFKDFLLKKTLMKKG